MKRLACKLMRGVRASRARMVAAGTAFLVLVLGSTFAVAQSGPSSTPFGEPTAETTSPGENVDALRGDRAGNWSEQSRSEVVARHGIVATSQPLAAQAGQQVLRDGGTAADAAIAAAAMLALVEPGSTGPGGDMFAIYYSADDRKLHGINASGPAPDAWTPEYFKKLGYDKTTEMPQEGVNSTTVPGAVDGWWQLQKRFGNLRFKDVLEPAAKLAEEGFGVSERIHSDWEGEVEKLAKDPDSASIYLRDGKAPALYSIFRNPGLARTFRLLQRDGRDAFYKGPIAHAMVDKIKRAGGAMTLEDLGRFRSEWVDPISTNYKGYDVHELPPNGQGFATLEMLNLVEVCAPKLGVDLAALGPKSPDFWHLLVEAKKLAYNDLHAYNADPRFADVPVKRLTSKEYAASLCGRIDMGRAAEPTDDVSRRGGTIYLTAGDRWGNMVSFIYSIYSGFGSGVSVPDYGFVLQNRGGLFSLDPDHPNIVAPRKRPFHTIIPAFITKDGAPVVSFGNMGGSIQPQAQATEVVNMVDLGMNVQAAGDAARFNHDQKTNELELESNLFETVGQELASRGHKVVEGDGDSMGGYQALHFQPAPGERAPEGRSVKGDPPVNGVYRAGSDHRKDGQAAGW